jgi:hypothetical protein
MTTDVRQRWAQPITAPASAARSRNRIVTEATGSGWFTHNDYEIWR